MINPKLYVHQTPVGGLWPMHRRPLSLDYLYSVHSDLCDRVRAFRRAGDEIAADRAERLLRLAELEINRCGGEVKLKEMAWNQ